MKYSIKELRDKQSKIRYSWGCKFALFCALLWGACYKALGLLISGEGFLQSGAAYDNPYAAGAAIAAILAIMIAAISVVWVAFSGGLGEVLKTMRLSKRMYAYSLAMALVGGIAACATYVTAGQLGTFFAVAGVIFYPVVGLFISQRWLREKIGVKSKAGMAVILTGCLALYAPAVVSAPSVGHFLGVLTGILWGIEGALAGKVIEIADSDSAVAVRFCFEAALWVIASITLLIFQPQGASIMYMKDIISNPFSMLMLFVIALCLAFNYLSWYRSFSLIGVFNGLVISNISGFVVIVLGMLLAIAMPSWLEITAMLTMLSGVFLVYCAANSGASVLRNVNLAVCQGKSAGGLPQTALPLKAQTLLLTEQHGPVWDFAVSNMLSGAIPDEKRKLRRQNLARTYMIEASAAGLLVSVDNSVDEGMHFGKGKLLSKYQITEYGYQQLLENKIIAEASAK